MDGEKIGRCPGLKPRDVGVLSVRTQVPVDLKHVCPRESERKSLKTKDKCEAVRRYPRALAAIEANFGRKADKGVMRGLRL